MTTPNLRHANVLVVEDNRADMALMKVFFAEEHISNSIYYAANLREAHKLLATQSFDICFIDVSLPDGEGFELIEPLIQKGSAVVMLSGSENMDYVLQAKSLGAVAYISKPLNKAKLDRLIKELRHLHWSIMV